MADALLTYATALIVLLGADLLWLGLVALDFYKKQLAPLMRERPRWSIALLFYALYAAGIAVLAVEPALADGNAWRAALLGGALGLCAYGAYDLTNLATLRHWPWRMAMVDMVWGTALTATAAVAGYAIRGLALFGPG